MSVQAKRRTSSQKRRRAVNLRLTATTLNSCASCGARVRPHRACPKCGEYTKAKSKKATATATPKKTAKKTTKK